MLELGVDPTGGTAREFAELIGRETTRWAMVLAGTGTWADQPSGFFYTTHRSRP